MIGLDSISWNILKETAASPKGLLAFTIYRRLSITPLQLAISARRLKDLALIDLSEDGQRLSLTGAGLRVLQKRPSVERVDSVTEKGAGWIARPALQINAPYVPRRSLL
jgi:hypothetical protein